MAIRTAVAVLAILGVASAAMAQQVADVNGAAAGAEAVSSADTAGVPLAYFDQTYMQTARDAAMRAEVERIFVEAGIPVDDLTEAALTGGRRSPHGFLTRVVIMDANPTQWNLPDHAMGVMIGRALPPTNVYLFYPAIMRVLGIKDRDNPRISEEEIGRALGRVVVHELVHAFAPDHKHGGWGIMGHAQDHHSLTVVGATLDEDSAEALREGWARAKQVATEKS